MHQSAYEAVWTLGLSRSAMMAKRPLKAEHAPAAAILDLKMPKLDGLNVLAALNADGLGTRVIFLSAVMLDHSAGTNGAYGIVLKDSAPQTLSPCLQQVGSGHRWFPREFVNAAREWETKRQQNGSELAYLLTAGERQIVMLVARGLSNKESPGSWSYLRER
jgi:two-component system nitrate/nitrite response regulator NarL